MNGIAVQHIPLEERRKAFLEMMDRIPQDVFRFRDWICLEGVGGTGAGGDPGWSHCGTHACVLGYAPFDPTLAKMGFYAHFYCDDLEVTASGPEDILRAAREFSIKYQENYGRPLHDVAASPSYRGMSSTRGAAVFLDIPLSDASATFAGTYAAPPGLPPVSEVTVDMVRKRLLEKFVQWPNGYHGAGGPPLS